MCICMCIYKYKHKYRYLFIYGFIVYIAGKFVQRGSVGLRASGFLYWRVLHVLR